MKRREFVGVTALAALQFYVQGCGLSVRRSSVGDGATRPGAPERSKSRTGFGPLVERPGQLLDLPAGFDFVIIHRGGDTLSDGHIMPDQPDGMACFLDDEGHYILLRNHELGDRAFLKKYGYRHGFHRADRVPKEGYDPEYFGGVVRVVLDPKRLAQDLNLGQGRATRSIIESQFVLAGTAINCAGGKVPDGWITCEETTVERHGYAFLTKPGDSQLMAPRRIDSWGRLHREAIALDPKTGVVYMTEDRADGCFYRHLPKDPGDPFGEGRLQALVIPNVPNSSPYPKSAEGNPPKRLWSDNHSWKVRWVDVADPLAVQESCRAQAASQGATVFNRSEGIAWDGRSVWFVASLGGALRAGQIFQYEQDPDHLEEGTATLRYEVADRSVLSCPDNLTMTPWRDLLLAEDNYDIGGGCTHQYIRGMDRQGQVYDIARNRNNFLDQSDAGAEFTGACFSPDGRYLFINMQSPENVTIAIRGPWAQS